MKDKSRILVLAALVLLFVVLSSGDHMFNGFRLFGPNRLMTILLVAAIFWFICGGCKGCCGWSSKAVDVDTDSEAAQDSAAAEPEADGESERKTGA